MNISNETMVLLALLISEIELSLNDPKITFPMGKRIHLNNKISNEQVQNFTNEIREKILFPSTR
jgi:hypothetical protein